MMILIYYYYNKKIYFKKFLNTYFCLTLLGSGGGMHTFFFENIEIDKGTKFGDFS